mmetsp:Transcript_7257/g.15859  ORF Transcript_7257/g.15859 Transcript_7257/m.15859 type:complete len:94 (+) Transcript_7257:1299-1580(+)
MTCWPESDLAVLWGTRVTCLTPLSVTTVADPLDCDGPVPWNMAPPLEAIPDGGCVLLLPAKLPPPGQPTKILSCSGAWAVTGSGTKLLEVGVC